MGKKMSWFSVLKRLFIPADKLKHIKKTKSSRWIFRSLKLKQCPSIEVPQMTLSEASEEQRKHAVAVAIATAAAAEAAVTAANAAAEVVRLTSVHTVSGKEKQNLAAIRIQTSFRAYLGRKALLALKGVVRLQAVVRGQNTRRLILTRLKSLQSTAKPQVHQIMIPQVDKDYITICNPQKILVNKDNKTGCTISKNWEDSIMSKEDMEVSWLQRKDAIARRDRMKKYSFSHRERRTNLILDNSINKDVKRRPWFEECQIDKSKSATYSDSIDISTYGARQAKMKYGLKDESPEVLNSSILLPRRSFCDANIKKYSNTDDSSLLDSPIFPSYMGATKSAKEKVRSASTPRHRLGHDDLLSMQSSLCYSSKLSSWSSVDGEIARITRKSST